MHAWMSTTIQILKNGKSCLIACSRLCDCNSLFDGLFMVEAILLALVIIVCTFSKLIGDVQLAVSVADVSRIVVLTV